MVKLYYVEDDENIAGIVKEYLEQKNMEVIILDTIAKAKQSLKFQIPSLVLVDWNLPDGRGDALCRWLRTQWKELPVIFLTVRGDSRDIVSGFQNGADDYVVKPFELEILYSRIMALLRRTGDISKQYLYCGNITIDQNRMTVSCGQEEVSVSPAEYQLLLYLMLHKGKTVTREKILQHVWDANGNFVNDNTLTVTMKRLRERLLHPSCLKTVRSVGYRMEDTYE